jgi:dTDP-4-dehydrorhamnose 3,5-epimerase
MPEMRVEDTAIADVKILRPEIHSDVRGSFFESWNQREFRGAGLDLRFVQDNQSRSKLGTLRGLHYQIEQPQGRLVRAVTGSVFDVVVDLRTSSTSFGQWVGVTLSDEHHEMLWIPAGFAHGFLCLTKTVDFVYKCTDYYAPEHERTIRWDDADLAIDWPLDEGAEPILSAKDRQGLAFRDADYYP